MITRSLSCAASVFVMSGLLLAGCGGGSSPIGTSTPGSSAAADSISSLDTAVSRAYTPNYAPVAGSDGVWSSRTIAVYVPSANDYGIADAAMHRWEQATNGYFHFNRVDSADQGQITFERVASDSFEAGIVGKTKYSFNTGNHTLTSAQVRIAQTGSETSQTIVAIHELGHALGIHGHSDGTVDAMYYAVTLQNAITERDLNTIFWMYNTANTSRAASGAGTVETHTLDCKHH